MTCTRRLAAFVLLIVGLFKPSTTSAHPWGGLVIDENGNIYFAFICPIEDRQHHACVWRISATNETHPVLESGHSPSDIVLARSRNRNVYGAERTYVPGGFRAALWRLDPTPRIVIDPTVRSDLFHIQAYAVDDDGAVFFARDALIYRRDTTGVVSIVDLAVKLHRVDAMTFGPEGKLYILDGDALYILAPDGQITTLATDVKQDDPEDLPFAGANVIFDIAVDDDGDTYLAYYGNRRVLKVTADGKVETFVQSPAPWSPHGVDVREGAIYVLESTVGEAASRSGDSPRMIPRVRKVTDAGDVATVFQYRPER